MSRSMSSHACVLGSMFYLRYAIFHVLVCSMPCLCLDLGYVCLAMCYCSFFVAYLSFLCFDLLIGTRSRPYGLCHRPFTLAHIKGFGSPVLHVYASLLLCFTLVLASLVLGLALLDTLSGFVVMWLHPTPMRPCLDVTIQDAVP